MTEAETGTFVRCSLMETFATTLLPPSDLVASFQSRPLALLMMLRRLHAAAPEERFSSAAVLFVTSLCSSPGDVTLWAHLLVTETRRRGRPFTIDDLALLFPRGFPSDEGRSRIWDAQKAAEPPFGNRLDTADAWAAP